MSTHADGMQKNADPAASIEAAQEHGRSTLAFQFADRRPGTIAQRTLQAMSDDSPRSRKLGDVRQMATDSPRVKQAAQMQATANTSPALSLPWVQRKDNNTGLPYNLKAGIESLSGISLDDVKVHRNSDKPAPLQALAYAQGTDIHLGPGQEKHLPHEAWHVVQQKQGRVRPGAQMKGDVHINDDAALEKEADVMGALALQKRHDHEAGQSSTGIGSGVGAVPPIQRKIELFDRDAGTYQEMEDGKAATGKGELFFTSGYIGDLPVFVNAAKVNEVLTFVEGMKGINEDTADDEYYKKLKMGIDDLKGGIDEALPGAEFYTDEKDVTADVRHPGFRLKMALSKPLLRDPLAKRGGFMNRFQSAFGHLFTTKTKEETETDLGQLPEGVQFQRVSNTESAFRLFGQGNKPMISGPYMYVRHASASPPTRDGSSVFTAPAAASMGEGDARLTDGTLTASLPAAQADSDELVTHKAYARKKSRGAGQIVAMGGWNALGYAGYYKNHGHGALNVNVDWEWLHIRGAQNGGATDAQNLVAGTSAANSAMIPVEDKINEWTAKADTGHPLLIRYMGTRVPGTNLGNAITLRIWAPEGLPGILSKTNEGQGIEASFNPTTESSFDRMHRQMVAEQLEHTGTATAADLKY
jgi:hypothetical protein